jgi:hypothetical protein
MYYFTGTREHLQKECRITLLIQQKNGISAVYVVGVGGE